MQKEIMKDIVLTIVPTNEKCLGINLTKEVKDLYNENSNTLKKKVDGEEGILQDRRPSMLLGWQNYYQEINDVTQTNLYV